MSLALVDLIQNGATSVDLLESLYKTWPIFQLGVESRSYSSFDRTGGNDDGFAGTYSALYKDHKGEFVIFDAEGPGRLNSLWFTSSESGHAKLKLGKLRFYFDGDSKPKYEIEANKLFQGQTKPFLKPFVFDHHESTGGFVSFVPVYYKGSLRITTENKCSFYIAHYDTFPADSEVESGASSLRKWPEPNSKGLMHVPLKWGKTGSGVIERIVYKPAQIETPRPWIKIWWDENESPAVDCPLDMFCGSGLGDAPVDSLAFGMEKGAWENRIPMPFWKSARIEVEGSGELSVQFSEQRYSKSSAGYLHATFSEESPTETGKDFVFLDQPGAGKLIATVLTVRPPTPISKGWWEGDTRTRIDGKRTPNYHGTGHEDDHCGGWSNEFLDAPFSLPMNGEPKVEMQNRDGQFNGNCTLYRVYQGVSFVNGIVHGVEHGHDNRNNYDYASVAFWYEFPWVRCDRSDAVDVCDGNSRSVHALTAQNETETATLESSFEGPVYREIFSAKTLSHLNQMSFTVAIVPDALGVLMRRTFDQFHGRQRARVLVDDQFVGWWYWANENRQLRWADADFFIPKRFIQGKRSVKISLDPPAGSPLWSASSYEIFSIGIKK